MGDFIAVCWPPTPEGAAAARPLIDRLDADGGWRAAVTEPGLALWVGGARPPPVRALAAGVWIVGDSLRRHAAAPVGADIVEAARDPLTVGRALSAGAWGRYVALMPTPAGLAVFRDPSGALDCVAWRHGPVSVATSSAGPIPAALLPDRSGLDWQVIAGWLTDPGSTASASALDGVSVVPPGHLLQLEAARAGQTPLWNPSDHTAPRDRRGQDLAAGLVEAVDLGVRGLTAPYGRLVAELSGGLDSAIVAASLVHQGAGGRVVQWLNYFGDRPEGDERSYAQAIAARLGVPLTSVGKAPRALVEADFAELACGLRPGLAGLDAHRDRDTAERLGEFGAEGLVSGQGGDVMFFQMPTPLIAADQARLGGLLRLRPALVADVARLSRRSAWSVLAAVRADILRRAPQPFHARDLAPGDGAAPAPDSPWAEDAARLPPAKRYQVQALFQAQLSRGLSRRRQAGDLIYPLLSQPVMEYCLGLSTVQLTDGRRDRALARRAFAERLPASVAGRRAKGDLTAHYGRTVAASLGVLRPLLLEGCLCDAGLLDRARLEAALTPERLIQDVHNGEILIAAAVESWVRSWQRRVPDCAAAPRPRPPPPR